MLKKFIIAFAFALFPAWFGLGGCIGIQASAYTFNVVQTTYDEAPIQNKSTLDDAISNAFSVPTSDYYIDLFYDYHGYYDDAFIRIYYHADTVSTPVIDNNRFRYLYNSNNVEVTYQSYAHPNRSNGSWSMDSYQNTWISPNTNGWSSSYDITLYIVNQTVDFEFDNNSYPAPDQMQGDTFFCNKDGFDIHFGVFCGPASNHGQIDDTVPIPYYYTDEYTLGISFDKGNSSYSTFVQSYTYWSAKYGIYVEGDDSNILTYIPMFSPYADVVYNNSMRGVRCYQSDEPSYMWFDDFEEMQDFRSYNKVSLGMIYNDLVSTYTDLQISDLYTEITFTFYKQVGISSIAQKSFVLDWSSLSPDVVPPPDADPELDPFQPVKVLNQTLNSTNSLLKNFLYGEKYIKQGFGNKANSIDTAGLNAIPMPEYEFTETELDSDAIGFFGWLVEWWYSSPFGLVALVSLTLLVIRTIIW